MSRATARWGSPAAEASSFLHSRRPRRSTPSVIVRALWSLLSLTVTVLALLPNARAGAAPTIIQARITEQLGGAQISLAISEPVRYQVLALASPPRIAIDLPDVRWLPKEAELPSAAGLVKGLRYGRNKPGTTRIVIDCSRPALVVNAALVAAPAGRHRLVIDLIAAGESSAPDARATGAVENVGVRREERDGLSEGPSVAGTTAPPVVGATGLETGDIGPRARGRGSAAALSSVQLRPTLATVTVAKPKPRPSVQAPVGAVRWVIAIDAGHGGQDPGAIGLSGVYEKDVTLAVARSLRDEIKETQRYKVVMVRNRDRYIRLRDRIAVARAAGADILLSLHADKTQSNDVRGLSVYTLSEGASDAEAAALAERENKADLIGGVDLEGETPEVTNILIDLIQRETKNDSARVASLLVHELGSESMLLPRTHRFAGFAVLKAPDVPSVLIELGYLSNPTDERLLRSEDYRRKLARAIARAIDGYFVRFEARNHR